MNFILINPDYIIYTDGACLGNPGEGGWATIIINNKVKTEKKIFGSELSTTNNRMELTAVIKGLNSLPNGSKVYIFTDSKYVINGIESWITNWKKNNWRGSNKKEVKNKELWMLLDQATENLQIQWNWVKGHSGDKYNDEVDQLARTEAIKLQKF